MAALVLSCGEALLVSNYGEALCSSLFPRAPPTADAEVMRSHLLRPGGVQPSTEHTTTPRRTAGYGHASHSARVDEAVRDVMPSACLASERPGLARGWPDCQGSPGSTRPTAAAVWRSCSRPSWCTRGRRWGRRFAQPPPAWLGGALSPPRLARASGSAAASNRGHDADAPPRWGNTATAGPAASRLLRSAPPSMPRLIPAESAHAARSALSARQAGVMVANQDWPMPSTCHGFSACPGSPAGHLG